MRGTPTRGPYAWWLIGDIRPMDERSAVSTADSASMSKVRQAAALFPAGHATGAGGVALLLSSVSGKRSSPFARERIGVAVNKVNATRGKDRAHDSY